MKMKQIIIAQPGKKEFQKFALLVGIVFLAGYSFVQILINYFQANFKLFSTLFELKIVALSYINTLGFIIVAISALMGLLIGFFYLKYIEDKI
ncbi:MAG: hypothetical protein ACOCXQ_01695 [Patescibacteria group bacterium]